MLLLFRESGELSSAVNMKVDFSSSASIRTRPEYNVPSHKLLSSSNKSDITPLTLIFSSSLFWSVIILRCLSILYKPLGPPSHNSPALFSPIVKKGKLISLSEEAKRVINPVSLFL